MEATLTPNEQYEMLRPKITRLARYFCHRYKGEYDDWLGEANLLYVQAVNCYDPKNKGFEDRSAALQSWVLGKIWWGLLSEVRKRTKACQQAKRVNVEAAGVVLADVAKAEEQFNLKDLLFELSDDARLVIEALLKAPSELATSKKRHKLVDFLHELGWCGERVLESIGEVKEALG